MKARSRPRPLWPIMLAAAVVWLALALCPAPARAQPRCTGYIAAITSLQSNYAELILWEGIAVNGWRMILTVNPDGTSWTILVQEPVAPDQVCFIAAGTAWSPGATPQPPLGKEG